MNESIGSAGRHEKIFEILKREIQQAPAGSRLESIAQLAQRFSVSGITVRNALLLLAKEGLLDIRHGSGTYVCAPTDKRHVGVLLDLDISLSDISYFWRRVVQQVRLGLRAHGYRARLYVGHRRPGEGPEDPFSQDLAEDVAEDRLSGLVLVWGELTPESQDALRLRQIPCVGSSLLSAVESFDAAVTVDCEQAVQEATRRLLQDRRRKLAYMEWSASGDPRRLRG